MALPPFLKSKRQARIIRAQLGHADRGRIPDFIRRKKKAKETSQAAGLGYSDAFLGDNYTAGVVAGIIVPNRPNFIGATTFAGNENSQLAFALVADQAGAMSIAGAGANLVNFNPSTGQVVVPVGNMNFEDRTSFSFDATISNANGARTVTITVNVINLNDTNPNAFSFTPITGAALSTVRESNAITLAGMGAQDQATVALSGATGAEGRKNGGAWGAGPWTGMNGDTFAVRHTTSSTAGTAKTNTLSAGTTVANFTTTTVAGMVATSAPVVARSGNNLVLSSPGAYAGAAGAITRTYTLTRAGSNVGTITLPYAIVQASDGGKSIGVLENATDGTTPVVNPSNTVYITGDNAVTFYASTFDETNGTLLRDIGTLPTKWTPRDGTGGWPGSATEANKFTTQAGDMQIAQAAGAEPFNEHMMDVGDILHGFKATWPSTGGAPFTRFKQIDITKYLELVPQSNGMIDIGYNIGAGVSVFARYKVGTSREPGDTIECRVGADGKFRLLVNNVEYDTAPFDVQSAPGSTGYTIPQQLSNGTQISVHGDQYSIRRWAQFDVLTYGTPPLTINDVQFAINGTNRELRFVGTYSGFPDGYSVRLETLGGTTIQDYTALTGVVANAALNVVKSFTEAQVAAGVGTKVRAIIRQNNNTSISVGTLLDLEDLTKPGKMPIKLGMNNSRAESWLEPIIARDLMRKGLPVYANKFVNGNNTFPFEFLHPVNFFPTSYDGDTGMGWKVFEGINVTDLGTYRVTGPAGMTLSFPNCVNVTITNQTATGADVTFPAGTGNVTFNVFITGPIPGDGSGKVTCLPKNDPYPERLYHDQWRDMYQACGFVVARPMETLMTNDDSPYTSKQFELVKGANTGHWQCWVGMMAQFSRDTNIEPWWCFHGNATEAHIRQVAIEFAKAPGSGGLPLAMVMNVEGGNEDWNQGGTFRGYWHNAARGHKMGLYLGTSIADAVAQVDLSGYNKYGGGFPVIFGNRNDPDYPEPNARKLTIACATGARFIGPVYGTGNNIWEAKRATAIGAELPDLQAGVTENADFKLIANDAMFLTIGRRYNVWRGERIRTIFREEWSNAGRNPDDIVLHMNRQNATIDGGSPAPTYNNDFAYVDATLKLNATRRIATAPYYGYAYYTGGTPNLRITDLPGGSVVGKPMDEILDAVLVNAPADAVRRGNNAKDYVAAFRATGHPDAQWSGYEGRQHFPQNYTSAANVALIQDKRTATCDAILMTQIGVAAPGSTFCLFSDTSDMVLDLWGMFNSMGDYVNPVTWAGKMLKEFKASYDNHKSVVNIIVANKVNEGTIKVTIARTGKVAIVETIGIIIEAGATSPILAGELTGGFRTENINFAANEVVKELTLQTNVAADRNLRLRVAAPGGNSRYTIGAQTGVEGINMLVRNVA